MPSPLPAAGGSGVVSPWNQLVPLTLNRPCGVVVPTPTAPPFVTRSASALFVLSTNGCASVVPRNCVGGVVAALPVSAQPLAPGGPCGPAGPCGPGTPATGAVK